ncbi:MAG: cobalamin biosynthesis protein [Eubacteriales bacterium]|nr:cobalamin biosynthesis protein [Eubacteriales bacterium]
MRHAKLVSFTAVGAQTAARCAALLPDFLCERYARTVDRSLAHTSLTRFAQQAMVDCDLLVFIGATGIAVRAVAPYLAGKAYDPAVVVIDEAGRFVIPLLSGHLGGANALAARLAEGLGAQAVITTATDGRAAFAVDTWAAAHGCVVCDPENIKHVSGALLRGETVGIRSAFPVDGRLPAQTSLTEAAPSGFVIGFDTAIAPFAHTLHLVPQIVYLGIGCRRGTTAQAIEAAVQAALEAAAVPRCAICGVASIDVKRNEAGLLHFCAAQGWTLRTFSAEELRAVPGDFTASAFVARTVGVDNVCERAAVRAAAGGRLLRRKTAQDGVTVALAAQPWRAQFEGAPV